MKFLRVYTDTGGNKPVILYAKVVKDQGKVYEIRYFSPMKKLYDGQTLFNYESVSYTVDDESVVDVIQGDDERAIGYQKVHDGWVRLNESDPDYEPSESEESYSDESTSLEDELSGEETDEFQDDDNGEWENDDD